MNIQSVKGKTAVVVCHDFIYGPPHELRDYLLRHGIKELLFIGHQNRYVKPNMVQSSYFEKYDRGSLHYAYTSRPVALPEPIAYCKDFFVTLYWSITKIKGPIHIFVGAGNINAFAGIVLQLFGLVNNSIYYAIDYVPKRLKGRILNFFYHGIDYLCASFSTSTWNYGKGMIQKRTARWKKKFPRQTIVPNGIRFRESTIVPMKAVHMHEIVYMGTLFAHQGILLVIKALKKIRMSIPDASLVIIGGGEYSSVLKQEVYALGLTRAVSFTGFIPDPLTMDKSIATASLGVATYDPTHPFIKNGEPGKVKRYLACGVPVLMTDISPIARELVNTQCGMITEYSIESIARNVVKFFNNEHMVKTYRENAVHYAKQFDWDIIYTKAFGINDMIKLIKSTFYKEREAKKSMCAFIKSAKQLSFGPQCERFEEEFAKWQGRKHCIMLNSGSSADLAMVQALINLGKIKRNDTIGFSAITWSTNVMSLIELGLKPVPIDVELSTLNVSSRTLKEALKKTKIKMLFLTNLLGFCDDIDEIQKICKAKHILLIEDNCESLGTIYKKRKLGNFGLMSSFSFYVGHHMSTVEGGAVLTDDEQVATMLRLVRAHGWDRNLTFSKQEEIRNKFKVNSTFYSRYTFYDLGYNLRPTEITGFIGRQQLKYIEEIIDKREQNFRILSSAIYKQVDKFFPLQIHHIQKLSNFAVPVICKTKKLRDVLVKKCDGILEIRPIVGGDMTKQPFFKKYIKEKMPACPNAHLIHEQGLYFGNNPELTEKDRAIILKLFTS